MRSSQALVASLSLGTALLVPSCGAFDKTPRAELVLVVDTDLPVPKLAGTMRVDVFEDNASAESWSGLVWTATSEFVLEDKRDWPASFGVTLQDGVSSARFLVRLRLYKTGRTRSYRGERFVERPSSKGAPGDLFVPPVVPTDEPRLIESGEDRTPREEPSPSLTVDRLVRFELREGERKQGQIRLLGDCAGIQADLAERRTCVDSELDAVEELPTSLTEDARVPVRGVDTWVGRWPVSSGPRIAVDCDAPEVEAQRKLESGGKHPLFDEEVCVPGGAFLFGDRGWGISEIVGFDDVAGLSEQRIVAVPRFFIDRYEYSVARAKQSPLAKTLLANDTALDFRQGNEAACTYSETAIGRDAFPLNCVKGVEARQLCEAEGRELTRVAAWQYALRNGHEEAETLWPWGDTFPSDICASAVLFRSPAYPVCGLGLLPLDDDRAHSGPLVDVTDRGVRDLLGGLEEIQNDAAYPFAARCWRSRGAVSPTCDAKGPTWTVGAAWSLPAEAVHNAPLLGALASDYGTFISGLRCMRWIDP